MENKPLSSPQFKVVFEAWRVERVSDVFHGAAVCGIVFRHTIGAMGKPQAGIAGKGIAYKDGKNEL